MGRARSFNWQLQRLTEMELYQRLSLSRLRSKWPLAKIMNRHKGFLFREELGCSTCILQVPSWRPIILQVLAPRVIRIICSEYSQGYPHHLFRIQILVHPQRRG